MSTTIVNKAAGELTATVKNVKAVGDGPGEFEAIISTAALDRDGEILDAGWWDPLPESIPIHMDHRVSDVRAVVARAVPFAEDGVLKARGTYASTPDAQLMRTLVAEGMVTTMSVGYRQAAYKDDESGTPHLKSGELVEASFVSMPANTEAMVTMAKAANFDTSTSDIKSMTVTYAVEVETDGDDTETKTYEATFTADPESAPEAAPVTEGSTVETPAAGAAKAAPAAHGSTSMAQARAVMAGADLLLIS